ncbi:MAG: pyruvate kinase [Balneola sp.]|nr:pyruvate kinase [Balneola sp.]|tara:strand:+ start:75502 stop:76935 length:1434 start_codon:yes stop_codon:yes gene_type:complete
MISARRRTKIVCTIGPSCNTQEKIEDLLLHGMNVARVNFSHGTHKDHAEVIQHIRKASEKYEYSVPVLMDLQGPKIRVGTMKDGGQKLETGSTVKITGEKVEGTSSVIPIDYKNLLYEAEVGNSILLDDGLLEFKVTDKKPDSLEAKVVVGGMLKSRKGVNLPNVRISIPAMTEKDLKDLEFGIEQDVDLIALSFVRTAKDVRDIISRVRAAGSQASIIAKIEKPEALDVIDEIIEEADGIMVARGDLGIEIPTEQVPIVQKMIIEKCRVAGKPVITATQMLDSMITNPRPTRAESSDVANAVLDGTDAVMLSGETAAGKYPMEAVNVMDRICRSIEEKRTQLYNSLSYRKPEWKEKQVVESLAYSCVSIADNVEAKAISTITHSGNTARRIAKFRPQVPIVAFTESTKVRRQLNLVWGVYSVKMDELFDTDKSVRMMEEYLRDNGMVKSGDRVIVATGMPIAKRGRTNMIKVSTID